LAKGVKEKYNIQCESEVFNARYRRPIQVAVTSRKLLTVCEFDYEGNRGKEFCWDTESSK